MEYLKGKRQLVRERIRWKHKIEVDFIETGWDVVGCVYLAQDLDIGLVPFDTLIYFGFKKMRVIF